MRKNKTVPFAVAWMDLKIVMLSEVSKNGETYDISSNPEKTAPRRQGEKPSYIEVVQQREGSLTSKGYC